MNNLLYVILFFALMVGACKPTKTSKAADPLEFVSPDSVWLVKYERTPCFGDCPVYTFYLTVDNNGFLESKYNFLEIGWYAADLDEESVHALIGDLEPEAWWNEDLRHQPEIADLPGRSIVYKHKDGLRWYAVGGRLSEQSEYIYSILDQLVNSAEWIPTEHRPVDLNVPEPIDVIVQLKEDVHIEKWMTKFDNFGITLVKKVAPNLSYYVVTWNKNKGTANDFLQYIKLDEQVVEAQWDQALNGRSKMSDRIKE